MKSQSDEHPLAYMVSTTVSKLYRSFVSEKGKQTIRNMTIPRGRVTIGRYRIRSSLLELVSIRFFSIDASGRRNPKQKPAGLMRHNIILITIPMLWADINPSVFS
jgi:hypothetical protein